MTYKLPLIAALAATLATPVLAQDINDMLNPRAMIAEMGLGQILNGAPAPRTIAAAPAAEIAALRLDTTVLSSPRPMLRPSTLNAEEIARIPAAAAPAASDVRGMLDAMTEAAADAPAGSNTLVVAGTNTAVVSGTNTAVIHAAPARLTLWRRSFGY